MIRHRIAILNRSTVCTDGEVQIVTAALQRQVNEDFAEPWSIGAKLVFVPKHETPPPAHWQLIYLDNSDVANALGYHDVTKEGLPLGKVFAGTDQQFGENHSVTASHELLEMLGDPYINLSAEKSYGEFWAFETCDAVEREEYEVGQTGVPVSNFVLPRYFDPTSAPLTPLDHLGSVKSPFEVRPGGYSIVYKTGQGWTQVYGSKPTAGDRAAVGSRRERRITGRDHWLRSTAE